jgi:hypothetical protein
MPFLRIFKHLLPRAKAWRLPHGSQIRALSEGVAESPAEAREFVDEVWGDLLPASTRALAQWEKQYGLSGTGDDATRRQALVAAWQATGGQSPRYLQDAMQAAGFPVYVHEWWSSGPDPYVARDPRDYVTQPLFGTYQCDSVTDTQPQCSAFANQPQCNAFLANDPGYLVNLNLTPTAPPAVPSDPDRWPYFLYWGAETFPETAFIPEDRRREFERLLLRLNPAQQWLVTLVDYYDDPPPAVMQEAALILRSDVGVTLDGSNNVEQWRRLIGISGARATQATAGLRPGFTAENATFNGHPSVDPDGTDDFMTVAHDPAMSITAEGLYVVAVIASSSVASGAERIVTKWGDGASSTTKREWIFFLNDGAPIFQARNAADTGATAATWGAAIRNGAARIVEGFHTGTHVGVSVDGGTDVTQASTFRADDASVHLFAMTTADGGPDLSTPMIAVLPFMPTTEQRAAIRAWLTDRYIP